jgi:hypothetical protein
MSTDEVLTGSRPDADARLFDAIRSTPTAPALTIGGYRLHVKIQGVWVDAHPHHLRAKHASEINDWFGLCWPRTGDEFMTDDGRRFRVI